jgi:multiple sugar transport system substrate-binding protein
MKKKYLPLATVWLLLASLLLTACSTAATTAPTSAPAGVATTAPAAGSATTAPAAVVATTAAATADAGNVIWLSTQLNTVEETEKFTKTVLKDFKGKVNYLPKDQGPYIDQILAESKAGKMSVSLLGGLHGDFPPFIQSDLLEDLTPIANKLKERGIPQNFLDLGKMGTTKQYYIPWMQATYVMAYNKKALQHLPQGADVNKLTYDQFKTWAANIQKATGERKFGLPAGPKGLVHRIFQGYLYPAFTGQNVIGYKSPEAVQMWTYFKDLWQYTNPQSISYDFMQDPLQAEEVWLAIDHTARLINAVTNKPNDIALAPAPSGPKGLAFMPVLAGMAIPKGAPNKAGAEALIEYMSQPAVQINTLREVAFFPVVKADLPADLPAGIKTEAAAVSAQINAPNALPALLPVGLGAKNGEFNKVYTDTFQRIVIKNENIQTVLDDQAKIMQGILNDTKAPCWSPDPASTGACQIK